MKSEDEDREGPVPPDGPRPSLRACAPGDPALRGLEPQPAQVRLVREYKGPTVEAVLDAADGTVDRLPVRLRQMLDAVQRERLGEADEILDQALGTVHQGPGHRRRRRAPVWVQAGLFGAIGFGLSWWFVRWVSGGLMP